MLSFFISLTFASAACGGERAATPATDHVWLVSAREVFCCGQQAPRLHVWRCTNGQWQQSSVEAFLASDVPGMPTCFWVHGWRVSHCDAQNIGWSVYRRLKGQARAPFRFVIWSWPSEQNNRLLEDARQKAHLADVGAYSLAWLIDRIHPQVPVSVVGFSLGARIAGGAMHLLGGGCLVGCQLPQRVHPQRCPARAVLLAGALDSCSFAAGQRNGQALTQTDRLLVMVNDGDIVLKWYPMLSGIGGPTAMGFTGAYGPLGGAHRGYEQLNVGHIVGRQHDWPPYFDNGCLLAAITDTALFGDKKVAPAPAAARSAPQSAQRSKK